MTSPRFSPLAADDLEQILNYIAQDNPRAASAFVQTLREKCQQLARFPFLGAARGELADGLRVFPVGNYVIYYRPERQTVRIERVLHGARDSDSLMG